MCGIIGIAGKHEQFRSDRMNEVQSHRGPDDSGKYTDIENNVTIAMRRLSILDLEGGKQPIANEDKTVWIVFNGEIYNSPELRDILVKKGHVFVTENSDTEVLVHLYEEKGENMLADLNGMFAFVIYDKKKKLLFGARDRTGIKPFYYSLKNGKFAFASELKSLLLLPWIKRDINVTSLYHYLSFQFVPAPDTIFSDIHKLKAGHSFVYYLEKYRLSVNRYWELNVNSYEERGFEEWQQLVREKLREAVHLWTLSDVPIACSLSGGIDSSAIVGLLAESGANDLRTYSLGFGGADEQGCNELPLARKVAEKWGTKHHEIILEPARVLDDLEHMVWHLDEPYGGGLPSWYIYELIGKDVKVALTGSGGDELFGNYGKFRIFEKPGWYRHLKSLKNAIKYCTTDEIKDGFRFPAGHFYRRYFTDAVKDKFILNSCLSSQIKIKTEPYLENIWNKAGTASPMNSVAYVDFSLQLPEEFLHVTDRFSMAHSVEARTPFLDHTLIELVFRIPPNIRTGDAHPKFLLKQAVKDLLPQELLSAPKRGFILPLTLWTRRELVSLIKELLCPEYIKHQGIFSDLAYDRIVKPHLNKKEDYTEQVWTLLMFQLWYRRFYE